MQLYGIEIFSMKGRVTRLPYACVTAIYFTLGVIVPLCLEASLYVWLALITALNVLLCSFPVRRLHDMEKSGTGAVLVFIPVLGQLYWLNLARKKGTDGYNRFGVDPLKYKFSGYCR